MGAEIKGSLYTPTSVLFKLFQATGKVSGRPGGEEQTPREGDCIPAVCCVSCPLID